MPTLSNNKLREDNMLQFLTAMNVLTTNTTISSVEGLYGFSFSDASQATPFSEKLMALVRDEADASKVPGAIRLSDLIDEEIKNSPTKNETFKTSCKAIFDIIKGLKPSLSFSKESGCIEISLPDPAFGQMFKLLEYRYLTISAEGKLIFDLQKYLSMEARESVIKLEGLKPEDQPMVFLNASALESKQMFFAVNSLENEIVEVTPYFFVPSKPKALHYHFVIDVSRSMEEALPALKQHMIALAKQLFTFQQHANLSLTTFSSGIINIGVYTQATLNDLENEVKKLAVIGDTPLYEVTNKFIQQIMSSMDHNNVLLFTDGQDALQYGESTPFKEEIGEALKKLQTSPAIQAKNKFYVFSYKVQQQKLMQDVAEGFLSEIINTDAPEFKAAQGNPTVLQQWAAARDLFSTRVIVSEGVDGKRDLCQAVPLNRSGQLAALPAIRGKADATFEVTVFDGDNQVVVKSTKKLASSQPSFANAAAIATLGIMPAPAEASASTHDSLTAANGALG